MFRITTVAILTLFAFLSLAASLWHDLKATGHPDTALAVALATLAVGTIIAVTNAAGRISRLVDRELEKEAR